MDRLQDTELLKQMEPGLVSDWLRLWGIVSESQVCLNLFPRVGRRRQAHTERSDVSAEEKLERAKLSEVRQRQKISRTLFPWLELRQTFLDSVSLQSFWQKAVRLSQSFVLSSLISHALCLAVLKLLLDLISTFAFFSLPFFSHFCPTDGCQSDLIHNLPGLKEKRVLGSFFCIY